MGRVGVDLSKGYQKALDEDSFTTDAYWTVGPVTYRRTPGGDLTVQAQRAAEAARCGSTRTSSRSPTSPRRTRAGSTGR
ncbi:hypothetical protein E4K10_03440 [Streptomyces sp. T1317-0309]|nr:hypothetical protein E4K10_03440 [Streptomyces sp. T1317-0309]